MKYLLSFFFAAFLAPFAIGNDQVYTPDENHTPPDVIQEQQERQEAKKDKTFKAEKQQDVKNPTTDPRFEKDESKMPMDREYDYPRY